MTRILFAVLLVGLSACHEPGLDGLCEASGGGVCEGAPLVLDWQCLGSAGASTCRPALSDAVGPDGLICMVVENGPDQRHRIVPLNVGARTEVFAQGARQGDTIDIAAFVLTAAAAPDACTAGDLSVAAACGAGCALKLEQRGVVLAAEGTTVDFSGPDRICSAEVGEDVDDALAEICDGVDNDCDGVADENLTIDGIAIGEVCTVGIGGCARQGLAVCQGGVPACNATAGAPLEEICDDIDNDCDGSFNEGLPAETCCEVGATRACGILMGACQTGTQTCEGNGTRGTFGPCLDADGMPTIAPGERPEACNAIDDDCDGDTDEGLALADANAIEPGDQPAAVGEACIGLDGQCASAGTVSCNAQGQTSCDFAPVERGPDNDCDGADNDCNGIIDDAFADRLGGACDSGLQGVCLTAGILICDAMQEGVTCNADVIPPGDELCGSEIDEDCDGAVDEGFDALGDACSNGQGICRANGVLVCSENAVEMVCDAVPAESQQEVCDGLDNDCDGSIDEGFDVQGNDPDNCGACGRRCIDLVDPDVGDATRFGCDAGVCVVAACEAPFQDQDGIVANGCECNANFLDVPDPDFLDRNCDGIDGDPDDAYFVSAAHGDDANNGSIDAPFRSFGHAISVARIRPLDIYLDGATYDVTEGNDAASNPDPQVEGQAVPPRVSIYGGYRYTPGAANPWNRGPGDQEEGFTTVLTGAQIVLRYDGDRERPVVLANLRVVASRSIDPFWPTAAIATFDVGDALTLRTVMLQAMAGADGADGQSGDAAPNQNMDGGNGSDFDDPFDPGRGGLGGENPGCFGTEGGSGGDAGQAGAEGQSSMGAGASGGALGQAGADGADGENGQDGAGGIPTGQINPATRMWSPRPSRNGLTGTPGGGGGGGGGSAQAGGGGGGAGGCPGAGGRAAQSGNMSVGLHVVGGTVHLQAVRIIAGPGGHGGDGGAGGVGELGIFGGLSGLGNPGRGGRGGTGGNGGCGGNAGGGAGGSSIGIFRVSPDSTVPGLAQSNVIFEDLTGVALGDQLGAANASIQTGAPGMGGRGGNNPEPRCGPPAEAGDDGIATRIGCCQPQGRRCSSLLCE